MPIRRPIAARTIVVVVFPGFQLLDATGPVQVFVTATEERPPGRDLRPYRVRVVSAQGGAVTSSAGLSILTEALPRTTTLRDSTVVVAGGYGIDAAQGDTRLVRWIARAAAVAARCCSVCTGAFMLARAGVLDGRTAVTHWRNVDALRRDFPNVRVFDDALFVKDGRVYSSAGVTAGIDLCLSLVEEDLGREVSLRVARQLVVYLKRPGGQRQFSTQLLAQESPAGSPIEVLTEWLKPRLHREIDVDDMAAAVALSPRTLHRRFKLDLDTTPAKYLSQLRLDAACRLLETSTSSLKRTAQKAGFISEYNLRRAFVHALGVTPSEYRQRFCV